MKISGEGAGDAAAAPGRGYLDRQGDRQPRQGKVARAGLSAYCCRVACHNTIVSYHNVAVLS